LPDHGFIFCAFRSWLEIDQEVFACWMEILTTSSCDAPAVHPGKDILVASSDAVGDIDERPGLMRHHAHGFR
jgi:hypothetical protein